MTAHRLTQERHSPGGPLLSVAEAGEYLGTGERFIRGLITQRRISYVKVGKVCAPGALDARCLCGRRPRPQPAVIGEDAR